MKQEARSLLVKHQTALLPLFLISGEDEGDILLRNVD